MLIITQEVSLEFTLHILFMFMDKKKIKGKYFKKGAKKSLLFCFTIIDLIGQPKENKGLIQFASENANIFYIIKSEFEVSKKNCKSWVSYTLFDNKSKEDSILINIELGCNTNMPLPRSVVLINNQNKLINWEN